jgi:hypothetical protein
MPYLKPLIEKAHAKGIPVIYTTGVQRPDNWDRGGWSWKNGRSGEDENPRPDTHVDGNEIVAAIAPGTRVDETAPNKAEEPGGGGLMTIIDPHSGSRVPVTRPRHHSRCGDVGGSAVAKRLLRYHYARTPRDVPWLAGRADSRDVAICPTVSRSVP